MKKHHGFTLLEMAVVMIILGLMTVGVLEGQNILRNAALHRVIEDLQKYKQATLQFAEKYKQLPGDFDNAHAFWDDGANGVCGTAAQCNGNRNGHINGGADNDNETLRAWQHLEFAEFIEGHYTGVGPVGSAGANPEGPFDAYYQFNTGSQWFGVRGNVLTFVKSPYSAQGSGALSNPDAHFIDSKMDDGIANQGELYALDGDGLASGACTAPYGAGSGSGVDYQNMSDPDTLACKLIYFISKQ